MSIIIDQIVNRGVDLNCQCVAGVNEFIRFDVTTMYAPNNSPQKHGELLRVTSAYYYGAADKSMRLMTVDLTDQYNEVFMYNDVLNNYKQALTEKL